MKIKALTLGTAIAAGVIGVIAHAQSGSPTKELMRKKLEHTQSILEGISLENFDLIGGHAARLSALSEEARWRATDTPEYAMHSVIFRRNAAALQKAAKDRNLDAATLAYTKLAFNCVECHKYLRNRKVADKTDKQIFLSGLIESLDE